MLTDKALKNLKPNAKTYEVTDGMGLSVRVSPGGALSFQYRYRFNGKAKRIRYGSYPTMSLKDARSAHFDAQKLIERGIDPVDAKLHERNQRQAALTVQNLIDEFIINYIDVQHRSEHAKRILRTDVARGIGKMLIKDVRRRDIVEMLDVIVARGKRVQANRTMSITKLLFKYAVERGLLDSSPASEISRRSIGGAEKSRERVLSDDEIRAFWLKAPRGHMSRFTLLALRLLLLTGQRCGELTKALKSDFDLNSGVWTIPAENSKNGKSHAVPLSPMAMQICTALFRLAPDSLLLLPSPDGSQAMTRRAITRAVSRSQMDFKLQQWTPHDLRRTAATGMAALGAPPYVVEKVLNHSMQGVMAVYNRFDYLEERRVALIKWSTHIRQIINENAAKTRC